MKKKIFSGCQQQDCFFFRGYGDWLALFNMVVCCKKRGRKKERKKWFELSHIRDNHPRNGYAKEYDEEAGHGARLRRCRTVISKAWMD